MERRTELIINEVEKAVSGKRAVLVKILAAIFARGHVLLEDAPGMGKTTTAIAFSKALGLNFSRIQFNPDTTASDIIGYNMYKKETDSIVFYPGAVFTDLLLGDEINRTSPRTQAALLQAMAERVVTVDGASYQLSDLFLCIATQNPFGSAGTQPLPLSQLDRFAIRLSIGYPSMEAQLDMIAKRSLTDPLKEIRKVLSPDELLSIQNRVHTVRADERVLKFAIQLCENTRRSEYLTQGVSPRAMLTLIEMAKANAFMKERDYIIPEDVEEFFVDVCAHRVALSAKARVEGKEAGDVLGEILAATSFPEIIR